MVQAIIPVIEAKMIYEAADKDLDLVKPDGKYHNSNTLAVMLAYASEGSGAKVYDYITRIHMLITKGYVETNRNPSRLTLTSKFKSLLK